MIRRLLRDYFSLTRSERRGLQLMASLVLLLALVRLSLPIILSRMPVRDPVPDQALIAFLDTLESRILPAGKSNPVAESYPVPKKSTQNQYGQGNSTPAELKPFDPNTADPAELEDLGIPGRTSEILVNYRNTGARFYRDSDLLNVYGMDTVLFSRLRPFIAINQARPERNKRSGLPALDLNSCTPENLTEIRGIGMVFSSRIIRYRNLLGGFYSHSQLGEVYGISEEQRRELEKRTRLDTSCLRKIDLNTMELDSLTRHPYLDRYQASAIIQYRKLNGSIARPEELTENLILPDSVFARLAPYFALSR